MVPDPTDSIEQLVCLGLDPPGARSRRRGWRASRRERDAEGRVGQASRRASDRQGRTRAAEEIAATPADQSLRDGEGDATRRGAWGRRQEGRPLDASAREPIGQVDDQRYDRREGEGAGGLAPQGLRGHRGSGLEPEPDGDALSSRAVGDAGRRGGRRRPGSRDRRRLWPQLASLGVDAQHSRTDDLRAHPGLAQRHGGGDFETAGGAPVDDQARNIPRRGRGRAEGRPRGRLCHGRRHGRPSCRQERLRHADRLGSLLRVSQRSGASRGWLSCRGCAGEARST